MSDQDQNQAHSSEVESILALSNESFDSQERNDEDCQLDQSIVQVAIQIHQFSQLNLVLSLWRLELELDDDSLRLFVFFGHVVKRVVLVVSIVLSVDPEVVVEAAVVDFVLVLLYIYPFLVAGQVFPLAWSQQRGF